MTEFEAIGWVVGGIVSLIAFYNVLDKFFSTKNKKDQSLEANWKATEEQRTQLATLTEQVAGLASVCASNQHLIEMLVHQRTVRIDHEIAKNSVLLNVAQILEPQNKDLTALITRMKSEQARVDAEMYKYQAKYTQD